MSPSSSTAFSPLTTLAQSVNRGQGLELSCPRLYLCPNPTRSYLGSRFSRRSTPPTNWGRYPPRISSPYSIFCRGTASYVFRRTDDRRGGLWRELALEIFLCWWSKIHGYDRRLRKRRPHISCPSRLIPKTRIPIPSLLAPRNPLHRFSPHLRKQPTSSLPTAPTPPRPAKKQKQIFSSCRYMLRHPHKRRIRGLLPLTFRPAQRLRQHVQRHS
jgi:hypothetical protein